MPNVLTINETVKRAKTEGYPVSECALRRWIKTGAIPVRKSGRKNLIYFPTLIAFLECSDGCDNVTVQTQQIHGIRRVEVKK